MSEHWCTYCRGVNAHNCQFNAEWPRQHVYVTNTTAQPAPITSETGNTPPQGASAITSEPAQAGALLSDDEVWDLWNARGCDDMSQVEAIAFARAIEQAVRAKLGVAVPMTDAQIEHALRAEPMADSEESFALGIRHAERHHGIVGKEGT